ncbi:hypothetical protein LRR81_12850 [Metabacillus sp. GX 13764]|uniref:hypothetical protein n=1 Tax=Metabacillus kandeliae TaxID=2900151 RepID=UPI001E480AD4|nr:hypothetical protein [Metabacillus kandeliae]MCD7035128.1 hypothetical protein [Metabacillus kandeliae]
MAIINRGQVVGVSYRAESGASCRGAYCVHNGRLVGGILSITSTTIRVSTTVNTNALQNYRGIILSHLAVNQSGAITQQFLYFSRSQLQVVPSKPNIRVTPYAGFGLPGCTTENHYNDPIRVYPGEGVGIRYFDTATGRWNIGNGRYLYWRGAANRCILNQNTNLPALRQIYYSHYVLTDTQGTIAARKRNIGPATGQTNIFVQKLRIPSNGEIIRMRRTFRRVYNPRSAAFFRPRTIVYV